MVHDDIIKVGETLKAALDSGRLCDGRKKKKSLPKMAPCSLDLTF